MTSVETAPAVRSPSRPTVVMRDAAALSDADSDAEPVAAGFTALPRNAAPGTSGRPRDPVSAARLAPVKPPARGQRPEFSRGFGHRVHHADEPRCADPVRPIRACAPTSD